MSHRLSPDTLRLRESYSFFLALGKMNCWVDACCDLLFDFRAWRHRLLKMQPVEQEVSGHDFTACGKTHSCGRPGIYPRHKANQINEGFSP
jgi:hypothetical protein